MSTSLRRASLTRILVFFCNDPATTEIYTPLYTLSLHDALPICLHVMLVGDDHAAVGDLPVAAQPEQRQHAEPGMRLHDAPLLVRQAALLVEHLEGHARLTDVVEQRRDPQVVQLQLGEA